MIITIRFLTNLPLTLIMFSLKPHILPLAVHLVFVVILKSEQVEGIILQSTYKTLYRINVSSEDKDMVDESNSIPYSIYK